MLVGGGVIAWRKAKLVAAAGAYINLVAPEIIPELRSLIKEHKGKIEERKFSSKDMEGINLVFVALGDSEEAQETARKIHRIAGQKNIPINVVDNQELCTFIVPAIVERSPLVVAISSAGEAPVAARRLREDLEARLPHDYGSLSSLMNEMRPLVKAKLPELERRDFYESLWDSQARHLLSQGKKDEAKKLALSLLKKEKVTGMVWLAGAGPGSVANLTLKTLQLMHQADVILHDRLVPSQILAMARRDATLISVAKPSHSQDEINKKMAELAKQGKQVLRLKGGDPTLFARLHEEIGHLKDEGISYAVSPGITAASAAASIANLSLSDRDLAHSVIFLSLQAKTAKEDKAGKRLNPYVVKTLRDNAVEDRTLIIYMGVENIYLGVEELLSAGMAKDTPCLMFEKVGLPGQNILFSPLADLAITMAKHKVGSPASIIIGKVASLYQKRDIK